MSAAGEELVLGEGRPLSQQFSLPLQGSGLRVSPCTLTL